MYIDIHTHLWQKEYESDIDQVIQRARDANLKILMSNGVDPKTNRITLEHAKKYDVVKAALGVYPVEALNLEINSEGKVVPAKKLIDLDKEIEFIEKNKKHVSAIGEVGLDFHWVKDKNKEQEQNLFKFIELSEKIKKPLILHTRKAEKETLECLQSSNVKNAILHCFSGKQQLIKKAIDQNLYFSIPTNVVFSQQFQDMTKMINISKMFVETDGIYMSPIKGERNEPKNIPLAYKKIAEVKGMDEVEVKNNIFMNYQKLFF